MKSRRPSLVSAVAALEVAVAAGIVLFWVSFFIAGPAGIDDPKLKEIYLAFETAFPVADFALACALVLGAAGLLKDREWGRTFTLAGGGMLVFLGLLDVSFNILQGIYLTGAAEAALNGAINLASLGSGTFFVVWAGRRAGQKPGRLGRRENPSASKPRGTIAVRASLNRSRP
jgi:hypothetical protein